MKIEYNGLSGRPRYISENSRPLKNPPEQLRELFLFWLRAVQRDRSLLWIDWGTQIERVGEEKLEIPRPERMEMTATGCGQGEQSGLFEGVEYEWKIQRRRLRRVSLA